jgi:hypothetical protein
MLTELRAAGLLDLSAALVYSARPRALKGGHAGRARSTAANPAPSTTWSPTPTAPRRPSRCPAASATTLLS